MEDKQYRMLCFLMGMLIALLTVAIVQDQVATPPAYAQGSTGGSSSQTFLVGTGLKDQSAEGCVWIIDPETKQIACYETNQGNTVRFVGARKILYDLKLSSANDDTPAKYSVRSLERQWKALQDKKGGGKQ